MLVITSHKEENEVFDKSSTLGLAELALRSGITVASEVHPRRGYC